MKKTTQRDDDMTADGKHQPRGGSHRWLQISIAWRDFNWPHPDQLNHNLCGWDPSLLTYKTPMWFHCVTKCEKQEPEPAQFLQCFNMHMNQLGSAKIQMTDDVGFNSLPGDSKGTGPHTAVEKPWPGIHHLILSKFLSSLAFLHAARWTFHSSWMKETSKW